MYIQIAYICIYTIHIDLESLGNSKIQKGKLKKHLQFYLIINIVIYGYVFFTLKIIIVLLKVIPLSLALYTLNTMNIFFFFEIMLQGMRLHGFIFIDPLS